MVDHTAVHKLYLMFASHMDANNNIDPVAALLMSVNVASYDQPHASVREAVRYF